MAFKMKGFPMQQTSAFKAKSPVSPTETETEDTRQRKLRKGKLLKTEHKDTWVDMENQIEDLRERISFIKEDIFNQKEGATAKQNKDIAAMEKRISKIKASMEKGKGSYGKEEHDKE